MLRRNWKQRHSPFHQLQDTRFEEAVDGQRLRLSWLLEKLARPVLGPDPCPILLTSLSTGREVHWERDLWESLELGTFLFHSHLAGTLPCREVLQAKCYCLCHRITISPHYPQSSNSCLMAHLIAHGPFSCQKPSILVIYSMTIKKEHYIKSLSARSDQPPA